MTDKTWTEWRVKWVSGRYTSKAMGKSDAQHKCDHLTKNGDLTACLESRTVTASAWEAVE